jgi:hypothetical protein
VGLRPKPIVHPRTHSLGRSPPCIEELMLHGRITLGNVRSVGGVGLPTTPSDCLHAAST